MLFAPIAIAFYAAFYAGAVYGIRIIEFGITLGSFWGHFVVTSGSFWDHSGVMMGSLWDHFRFMLRSLWDHFGITEKTFWDHQGHIFQTFFSISHHHFLQCFFQYNIILFVNLNLAFFINRCIFANRVVPCNRLQPIALQSKRLNSKRQKTKKTHFFLKPRRGDGKSDISAETKKNMPPGRGKSLKCT